MTRKMLKGHDFWIISTGKLVSVERLRNGEVTSVATEQFKGVDRKQSHISLGK